MFTSKICLATVLLSLHAVNSYILLTANLDDMHSLAKQIAESPVANQINDIIRRAANIIKQTGVHGNNNSSRKSHVMRADFQLDQEQPETKKPQTINVGEPQTNGDQNKVEKTNQNQQEIEKPDQNQSEIEKTDQNQSEIEKTDQNPAEGQKVAGNTDTESENEKQNIEVWKPDQKVLVAELSRSASDSSSELSGETNGVKLQHSSRRDAGIAELGRNASYYLNSIKKIFENI